MPDGWLGDETVGELIARSRERLGKSQYTLADDLAKECGRGDGVPDRNMVARWETGRRIPTPYWRAHLAAVLQIPPALLDRATAVSKAQRAHPEVTGTPPADNRLRHHLSHPGSVDLVSVAYLRQRVRRLDEQYDRAPSTALLPEAGQHLGQIAFFAAHARSAHVRRELLTAEAEAATLMGQLVWDASQRCDHGTAVAYFDQAVRAARERGDKPAEGLALLRKGFVALYGWRDPKAGLAYTQQGADTASGSSHVLTGLAMLHAAEAHAMLGDRFNCENALGAAEAQFGRIEPGDPAIDLYSPTQHGRLAGSCYLSLHDPKTATAVLARTAQSLRDRSKAQAVALGNLALAHIRQANLDAALDALHRAIDVTEQNRGGAGMSVICGAGRELRRWTPSTEVQAIHDRILALIAA